MKKKSFFETTQKKKSLELAILEVNLHLQLRKYFLLITYNIFFLVLLNCVTKVIRLCLTMYVV